MTSVTSPELCVASGTATHDFLLYYELGAIAIHPRRKRACFEVMSQS